MHYGARVCGGKVGARDAINHIKTERYTFNGRANGHRCWSAAHKVLLQQLPGPKLSSTSSASPRALALAARFYLRQERRRENWKVEVIYRESYINKMTGFSRFRDLFSQKRIRSQRRSSLGFYRQGASFAVNIVIIISESNMTRFNIKNYCRFYCCMKIPPPRTIAFIGWERFYHGRARLISGRQKSINCVRNFIIGNYCFIYCTLAHPSPFSHHALHSRAHLICHHVSLRFIKNLSDWVCCIVLCLFVCSCSVKCHESLNAIWLCSKLIGFLVVVFDSWLCARETNCTRAFQLNSPPRFSLSAGLTWIGRFIWNTIKIQN